ncbi:DUF2651 family protein [Vallitalea pronyensis]|uniref:DUF2651 family protein n=1 Tax=Vallitalea pronyensis TaxID=1348613 RepID=A0A8J8SH47_9FIRM|nr:DUF2651 family protein [Vallitalea pronyensis]QUI23054.1 DUF2651 family protein [Vallitalea pronyensis]
MVETFFMDTAMLMLFTLPVITTIYSIIAGVIIKDKFIVAGIVLITYLFIARFFLGKAFLAWVSLYVMLSFIITWLLEIMTKHKRRQQSSQEPRDIIEN